jgi:orotate phosphoribosyltransferase
MTVLDLYREVGALHEGHFLLASGRHSPMFLQSTTVLQHPRLAERIGRDLADRVREAGLAPSFVIGPAMGGVTLAYEVARHLDTRALFAEKDGAGGMFVREALSVAPGETFVAVEDVLTTGGSVLKAVRAAQERGGVPLAVACIVDRRKDGGPLAGHPLIALEHLYFETYAPDELPAWLAERPLREI